MTWRATQTSYDQVDGWAMPPAPTGPRVLARAGELELVADGHVLVCRDGGATRWERRFDGLPGAAHISADRALVTTRTVEYHAWGFLGPAFALDLADGDKLGQLRGERGAALAGGRFVLGLEGYDRFDTYLIVRSGDIAQGWRSYGHYVVDPDDTVRVLECDRGLPTRSRVVRLRLDGTIERGPALVECQIAAPVVLDDGTIVALDAGTLRAFDRALGDTTLATLVSIDPHQSHRYACSLSLDGDRLAARIVERHGDSPFEYVTHRWAFALARA